MGSLEEYMTQVFSYYPAIENAWYTMSRQEQAILDKLVMVLEVMLMLIVSGSRTTKRDIFYQHFCDFNSQRELGLGDSSNGGGPQAAAGGGGHLQGAGGEGPTLHKQ